MKKFFNSMEERFVFPIGRRSWQVLSLLGLIVLALSVTKAEVIVDKVDTTATVV